MSFLLFAPRRLRMYCSFDMRTSPAFLEFSLKRSVFNMMIEKVVRYVASSVTKGPINGKSGERRGETDQDE